MWAPVRSWLRGMMRRARVERELADELRFHVDARAEQWERSGLPADEALRRARLELGSAESYKERCREARGLRLVDEVRADVRFALRLMRRAPVFTLSAIVMIALAIGANTAIFSLVDAILLRTLPVDRPQDLVFLDVRGTRGGNGAPPYPCFDRLRRETSGFAGMAAFAGDVLRVEIDGRVEQVFGQTASTNYFEVLGLRPAAGRFFTGADEKLDPPMAVIGYGYWQRRFGGAAEAIGRTLKQGTRVFTIVGVTPPGFRGLQPGRELDVTLPIHVERDLLTNADTWWLDAVARLRPGKPVELARAEADTIFQSFMKDHNALGDMRRTHFDHLELTPASRGLDRLRSQFRRPLTVLMALAATVLLIACANLANLLHARGAARSRELAIRLATGAGRGRLIRQLLTETLVLFGIGGVAGVFIGWLAVQGLTGFVAIGRQPIQLDVQFDWRLASLAALAALVTGVSTGLWPAVRALRTDPQAAMKQATKGLAGARGGEVAGRALVIGQVALSLVLMASAVLFVRTMANLRAVDLGFANTRVLTMSLDPMLAREAGAGARPQFWSGVLERVGALPGVRAASLSVLTPLSGRDRGRFMSVNGFQPRERRDRIVHINHVSEDYFRVYGIQLLAGRLPQRSDGEGAARVVVLNEAAASFYFAGRSPIGETVGFANVGRDYQVIGIVANQKHMSLREPAVRSAFVPLWQPIDDIGRITLAVAASQEPAALAREAAAAVRAANPSTLVSEVLEVEEQIDATLVSERLLSTLASAFAALAVALAAIGLYGVLSYAVTRRRAEFGVRLALGAPPARVAWDASRAALIQVALGIAIGLPAAVATARAAQGLLFGVAPAAADTYVISVGTLAAVACLAAFLPARRASRVDPVVALREG
jgi:predicted permease